MDDVEFDGVCAECECVQEAASEDALIESGWVLAEFGLLCPACGAKAVDQAQGDSEAEVLTLIGQTDLFERVLLDGLFPDAPREAKDEALRALAEGTLGVGEPEPDEPVTLGDGVEDPT